jgi:hypothetical protein
MNASHAKRTAIAVSLFVVVVFVLMCLSCRKAQVVCDDLMAQQRDEYSRYSTRFTFFPSHHMLPSEPLANWPCWVVSYLDQSGWRQIAFKVDMTGNIVTSGKGITASKVAEREKRLRPQRERFQELLAKADAIIQPGVSYSKLVETLGDPDLASTNNGRVFIYYDFPEFLEVWLDNPNLTTIGFSVCMSNDIVVSKGRVTRR